MPFFNVTPRLFAAHNEYRLTGGGTTVAPLTGKISPATGRPFFQGAIGHSQQSAFTKLEVSVPAVGKPGLKILALDAQPHFANLAGLEKAIGRPLVDGEWVKTFWTRLEHEDGMADWAFDRTWPEYSAKHQVTAADRVAELATDGSAKPAPVISFINSLSSTRPETPLVDFDGVKRVYFVRRIEVDASPAQGSYFPLANRVSVGELEAALDKKVVLHGPHFADPNKVIKLRQGTEVLVNPAAFVMGLAPEQGPHTGIVSTPFNASLEWMADGLIQAPIQIVNGAPRFIGQVPLPVPPGTKHVELWFVAENVPWPGLPFTPARKVTPGNNVNHKIEFVG